MTLFNLILQIPYVLSCEGSEACQHLKENYPQRPHVHLIVVGLAFENFWRQKQRRAKNGASYALNLLGETEISKFNLKVVIK
jgi:hypothetical protein